jgi:nitrate/nitrite transporter NarK
MPASLLSGTASAAGIAMVTTAGGLAAFFSPIIVGFATKHTGSLDAGLYFYAGLIGVAAVSLVMFTRGDAARAAP